MLHTTTSHVSETGYVEVMPPTEEEDLLQVSPLLSMFNNEFRSEVSESHDTCNEAVVQDHSESPESVVQPVPGPTEPALNKRSRTSQEKISSFATKHRTLPVPKQCDDCRHGCVSKITTATRKQINEEVNTMDGEARQQWYRRYVLS